MQTNQSFTVQIVSAIRHNDRALANALPQSALQSIGQEIVKIVEDHPTSDLPLVIASLRITASAFEGILPDSGKLMASHLVNLTESIVVNKSELLRQHGCKEDDQ